MGCLNVSFLNTTNTFRAVCIPYKCCCCPLLLSAVAVHCCCPLLLPAVAVHCCCPMLLSAVAVRCCCPLWLSAVAVHCCRQLLLSTVAVRCCCHCQCFYYGPVTLGSRKFPSKLQFFRIWRTSLGIFH